MKKSIFCRRLLATVVILSVLITSAAAFPVTAEAAQTMTLYPGESCMAYADNSLFSLDSSNKSVATVELMKSHSTGFTVVARKPGNTKISGYVGKLSGGGFSLAQGRKTKTINVTVKELNFTTSVERVDESHVRVAVRNDMKQGFVGCKVQVTLRDKDGKTLKKGSYYQQSPTSGKTLYTELNLRGSAFSIAKADLAKVDAGKSTAEVVSVTRKNNSQTNDITSKAKFAVDVNMESNGTLHFDVTVTKKNTSLEGCYAMTQVLFYNKNNELLHVISEQSVILGTCDYYELSASNMDYDHYVIENQCIKRVIPKIKRYQV